MKSSPEMRNSSSLIQVQLVDRIRGVTSRLSQGPGAIPAGTTPLAPIPCEHLPPDLILTRKRDFRPKSGQIQVRMEVFGAGRGQGAGSGWGGLWVPESLERVILIPLKFRRVTIRRAQASAGLSEEICLSEGFLEASARVSQRVLRGSAGFCGGRGIFRG